MHGDLPPAMHEGLAVEEDSVEEKDVDAASAAHPSVGLSMPIDDALVSRQTALVVRQRRRATAPGHVFTVAALLPRGPPRC